MCQDATSEVCCRREDATTVGDDSAWDTCKVFADIAHALARGYTDLYYVNMDTDELIEYHTDDTLGVLTEARRGSDFFEGCERDAKFFIHEEDQDLFVRTMKRDYLEEVLSSGKPYQIT